MERNEPAAGALKAYQAILERSGHRKGEIYKRMHVARCIMASIPAGRPPNLAYREAVDAVLNTMPDEASLQMCRAVARDLYPFFEQDVPTIAAMTRSGAFERNDIRIQLPEHKNLDDLIHAARAMMLTPQENVLLNGYADQVLAQGVDAKTLENRTTTARLLLLGMRDLPYDGKHYRAVVDRLLPLFTRDETRAYFLFVAREFYPLLASSSAPT